MEFIVKPITAKKMVADCAVVGVYENKKLSPAAIALDATTQGAIHNALRNKTIKGQVATTWLLSGLTQSPYQHILLVGLGKKEQTTLADFRQALDHAAQFLRRIPIKQAVNYLTHCRLKDGKTSDQIIETIKIFEDQYYQLHQFKTEPKPVRYTLKKMFLVAPKETIKTAKTALNDGLAIASGMTLMKNLANLPSNICTPNYLANQATTLAKKVGAKIKVFQEKEITDLKMNGLLTVAKGSQEPPRFIELQYWQASHKDEKPIILVGKGITFDSGGISLKPALNMEHMKYDMSGAAAVLGTFQAVAMMHLPINLIALIPTCENLPSGKACKPGDIITTMSGLTVEIFNTDAEGRLILCDALHYAKQFEPQYVIDVATLTGACVATFGSFISGLFANHEPLAKKLRQAAGQSGDWVWQMPLHQIYDEQIKGRLADLANIGGPTAGSITAAKFLSHFTESYHWAHLDIAGTAYQKEKQSTGRPVPLLATFLKQCALRTKLS